MHEPKLHVDADREAALEILLLLADGQAREHEYKRALDLLSQVEYAGEPLTPEYRMKRRLWDAALRL
jgi:hypothetical protein